MRLQLVPNARIVGAVGATAHIRDGLMVAVDCAHGSVQRLQA